MATLKAMVDEKKIFTTYETGDLVRVHEPATSTKLDTVGRILDIRKGDGFIRPSLVQTVSGSRISIKDHEKITLLSKEEVDSAVVGALRQHIASFSQVISECAKNTLRPGLAPIWRTFQYGTDTANAIPSWFVLSIGCDPDNQRMISWAESPRYVDNVKRRRSGRMSRLLQFMNSRGMVNLTETDIEQAATQYGDSIFDMSDYTFEEVTGLDLVDAYRKGPHSCMKDSTGQYGWGPYFYAQSPDQVALLKILYRGAYKGRAVVWTLDNGDRLMDRVYGGVHFTTAAINHAIKQGWDYRGTDGYLQKKGVRFVTLENKNFYRETLNGFPYLDTLSWWPDRPEWEKEYITQPVQLRVSV